ncbi:hypothetical protein ABZ883_04995 [Streptomyces sp. NPDC046977]|uniref:hypothetical protein n=1 Tax=Streptomyces sp. NPDC046977 TaxID=3154703 RepID=UPI0033FAF783
MEAVSVLSLQYVQAEVSATVAGEPFNPTGDFVEFAFSPLGGQPDTWYAGSWDGTEPVPGTNAYRAQVLVGPAGAVTLPKGKYVMWIKIHDSPEQPVLQVGQLTVN